MLRSFVGALPVLRPLVRKLAFRRARALVHDLGATLERRDDVLWLTRNGRTIVLADAHLPFAPEIAASFDDVFGAVEATTDNRRRDFSVPAEHHVAALGGPFWLSSPIEGMRVLEQYASEMRPSAGDCVFDLGANCGLSTVMLARLVGPTGAVHAWEPDPGNRAMLERNVARYAPTIAVVHPEAIGGRAGRRSFTAEASLGAGFAALVPRAGLAPVIDVPVVTLEGAAQRAGRIPTSIKMDVEGAELEIVEAARSWLQVHRPTLVIDTQHRIAGAYTDRRIEALLSEIGYVVRTQVTRGSRLTSAVHRDAVRGSATR